MNLSFIWHMHQPDYRSKDGIMQMPWVFLHAIKDYYDMPWMLSKYTTLKATFNITSPLIEQLELYYKNPEQSDKFFALWVQEPTVLAEHERKWLIKMCHSSPFDTMVKPLPRYVELFEKKHYTNNELLDLEMVFILAWCGNYLKQNNKTVQKLLQKGRNYSIEEKAELLQELCGFIAGIWEFYKQLWDTKCITLSTTPFYHPILPLLLDMANAQKANPNTIIPKEHLSLKEDAALHVTKAKKLFKKHFGRDVTGMWPAEGAVDTKSVDLLSSFGIEWIASDEAILYKSLNNEQKENIYIPYKYKEMTIVFRDHQLSDLIGFEYRYKTANDAAADFMRALEAIQKRKSNAVVFVILDGENAWEYYKNNGFDFFQALYASLQESSIVNVLSMDEVMQEKREPLVKLAPGSWINGTFDTWVAEREKRRAWELLYLSKRDYEHHKASLTQEQQEKITALFLIAESSDWFWWYGSDHHTNFDDEFDLLFRNNLIEIYELMLIHPPQDLFMPIVKNRSSEKFLTKPQADITPIIDGRRDSIFEWMGAGVVDEYAVSGAMQQTKSFVKKIYYGQDEHNVYVALQGELDDLCKDALLNVIIEPVKIEAKLHFNEVKKSYDGVLMESACVDWLELAIEKSTFKCEKIILRFEIEKEGHIVQILPGFGELEIILNDDYSQNWFV